MSVRMKHYVLLGQKIAPGPMRAHIELEGDEFYDRGTPGPGELGIVYDGMSGEDHYAGKVLAVGGEVDGFDGTEIAATAEDFATVGRWLVEQGLAQPDVGVRLYAFTHWS